MRSLKNLPYAIFQLTILYSSSVHFRKALGKMKKCNYVFTMKCRGFALPLCSIADNKASHQLAVQFLVTLIAMCMCSEQLDEERFSHLPNVTFSRLLTQCSKIECSSVLHHKKCPLSGSQLSCNQSTVVGYCKNYQGFLRIVLFSPWHLGQGRTIS